jgi:hypothetical protein
MAAKVKEMQAGVSPKRTAYLKRFMRGQLRDGVHSERHQFPAASYYRQVAAGPESA